MQPEYNVRPSTTSTSAAVDVEIQTGLLVQDDIRKDRVPGTFVSIVEETIDCQHAGTHVQPDTVAGQETASCPSTGPGLSHLLLNGTHVPLQRSCQ